MNTPSNPNHHLWFNNGTWFVHYTVYPTPLTKERIRRSLKTRNLEEARLRRDVILSGLITASAGGSSREAQPTLAVAPGGMVVSSPVSGAEPAFLALVELRNRCA
ncbi:MAG: hypothetical protein JWM88_2688 [Verrucomicrobia bacterium]|nr:hypothetical protein [Verrucomicrobiota bacterium]